MLRFSEYSFKDPCFSLETIGTFKCEVIKQLAITIEDILFPDEEPYEASHTNEKLSCFLSEIRGKAEEITEIMEKLDRELREMGVGMYAKEKQPEAESAAQIAEPQGVTT